QCHHRRQRDAAGGCGGAKAGHRTARSRAWCRPAFTRLDQRYPRLSKIEAGRMELNLDTFALPPLIDGVVKTIEPLAAKNGNHVAVHCDAALGMIHADQMRLRQALLNLMSNANKFTEKGTLAIAARQKQEHGRD